jgi:hypothetical protein
MVAYNPDEGEPSSNKDDICNGNVSNTFQALDVNVGEEKDTWLAYYEENLADNIHRFSPFLDDEEKDREDGRALTEDEVEEFEYCLSELPDEKVIIKVFLQEAPTRYEKWMQTMHVRCSHNGKEIANGKGVNIKRGKTCGKIP